MKAREKNIIRLGAVKKMALSIWPALFVIWTASTYSGWLLYVAALSMVPFFCHLTELIKGVKMAALSERWKTLNGWQRGVLGVCIVTGVFLLITVSFALVESVIYHP